MEVQTKKEMEKEQVGPFMCLKKKRVGLLFSCA